MSAPSFRSAARLLRLVAVLHAAPAGAAAGAASAARVDADLAAGMPVVVHVVVALCDNEHQGIVPVPKALGDGQDPRNNLYWGALYGISTHLPRAGWERVAVEKPSDRRILQRAAFFSEVQRGGVAAHVFIVADAWDGAEIRAATSAFLAMAAGAAAERVVAQRSSEEIPLRAGGDAHVVAYVGHDGLMDFTLDPPTPPGGPSPRPRSAIVLACASRQYFTAHLDTVGAHALLLTTGLMAPEAYTLDAALRSWARGSSTDAVGDAAAAAYDRYQKCGSAPARRLFWGAP